MTAHSQLAEPPVAQSRGSAARKLLRRMAVRRKQQHGPAGVRAHRTARRQLHLRMKKRKAAMVVSAGAMGLSSAAMASPSTKPARTGIIQIADPLVRLPAANLHASESFKQALVQEEGVRHEVYLDTAGHPTVGVGHLVTPADRLKVGNKISYDRILDFLEDDLREAEAGVVRMVGDLPLFQHEFDALVDLIYNVGAGNVSPRKSPRLNAAIAAGDYDAIAEELDYHYAAGQMARGLVYRSERRARIFTNAAYEDPRTASGVVMRGSG